MLKIYTPNSFFMNNNSSSFVLTIPSNNAVKAYRLFEELMKTAEKRELTSEDVVYAVKMINKDNNVDVSGVLTEKIKVGGWANYNSFFY